MKLITKRKIVSFITGLVVLSLTFNPVRGILDIPHQSSLFAVSFLSCVIGVFSLVINNTHRSLRLTAIDLWVIIIAIVGICLNHPFSNLFDWGCFSLLMIYWGIRQTKKFDLIILYKLILIAILVLSFIGYFQEFQILPSYHPYFEITGPFGNPSVYAGVLCLLISVPIIGLLYSKEIYLSGTYIIVTIIVFIMLINLLWITYCRSAWVAFIMVAIYIVNYKFQLLNRFSFCRKALPFLALITFSFILLLYLLFQFKSASTEGRILIWKVTTQMIKEKPVLGFGKDGFVADYMHYQADYLKAKGSAREKYLADNNHTVYNEPLRWMVEYGIGGLLLYGWILCCIFTCKVTDLCSLSSKSILIAGVGWGLFSYPDQAFPILVIMTIALAGLANRLPNCYIHFRLTFITIFNTLIFILVCWQSYVSITMYQDHRFLYGAIRQVAIYRSDRAIKELIPFEKVMNNERTFWGIYCQLLNKCQKDSMLLKKVTRWKQLYPSSETYILQGDAYHRLGRLNEAEKSYWTAHYMVPNKQKARTRLVTLYNEQRRTTEAIQLAREILSEKVKVYSFETYDLHKGLYRILKNDLE